MPTRRTPRTSSARLMAAHQIKAAHHQLLAMVQLPNRRIRVKTRTRGATIVTELVPDGDPDPIAGPQPGLWLSPMETLILDRIRKLLAPGSVAGKKITGGMLSGRAGYTPDPQFKAVLRNMVDRRILTLDDETGYGLAEGV